MHFVISFGAPNQPMSLLDGLEAAVTEALSITNLRHRSALIGLGTFDGVRLVAKMFDVIQRNYVSGGATANKDKSKENWRWHSLQSQIAPHNRSPEVVVERAIARACAALKRNDWANQVPVASGLIKGAGDGRRAIDLVRRHAERHFEFIELKIASDTPLYAAVEIIGYACLWIIARGDRPNRQSALLDADRLDLTVLAPIAYFDRYSLHKAECALDDGIRALGEQHDVALSFAFRELDGGIKPNALPVPDVLLDLLGRSPRVCAS